MPRRNHRKHSFEERIIDTHYDTDICFLPHRPQIKLIVAHPLKTVFRNADAASWAWERKEIYRFDDDFLALIMEQKAAV